MKSHAASRSLKVHYEFPVPPTSNDNVHHDT